MPRCVAPRIEGMEEIMLAEEQHEYLTICVAVAKFSDGSQGIISRWKLTDEEKEKIVNGDDIYLTLWTFGAPMQPVNLSIGLPEVWEQKADEEVEDGA